MKLSGKIYRTPHTEDDYFIYHGQVMDAATLGNVTYSYIASKYYSDFFTLSGGAAVQTKRRAWKDLPFLFLLPHCGEMPEDIEAIKLGIKWRKEGFPDDN
ncbi:polymorphic toxin type 44 domain-containing protein [Butyrivibrio sp. X503]|uniref:polymorphic toxin type 44 domain-containing protein n=1 Tax=Butyrivibrio sp. X503 TaxID=2364878 RepID=UPI001313D897|nr:polymorphic toxin type 44 domain-containing protein [Butyrivibrio sp. X503]